MNCTQCGSPVAEGTRYCTRCGNPLTDEAVSASASRGVSGQILQTLSGSLHDRYRVVRPLGRGGMSYVFLAEERKLDRRVAIKVLAPHLAEDPNVVDRFMREARTVARLGHPNIVSIYDVGEAGQLHYFVMEFMSGKTLSQILKNRDEPLDVPVVTTWLTQVGGALDVAHRHDVVHRDIKPGNILFDRHGNAHVADFGIAKLEHVPRLTQVGMVLGTPTYMSPEQFVAGSDMGPATDQYSLGVVAYEMLAGDPPFTGSDVELFMAHRETVPTPLHEVRPEVPRTVSDVIGRMLAKEPSERFPGIGEAVSAMEGRLPGPGDPLVAVLADLTTPTGEIRIEAEEVTVETGGRVALDATVYGEDGQPLPSRRIEWATEDDDVVSVTPEGIVVGLAEGDATIVASCEGIVATHVIRVVRPGAGTALPDTDTGPGSEGQPRPSVQIERGGTLDLSGEAPPEAPGREPSGWRDALEGEEEEGEQEQEAWTGGTEPAYEPDREPWEPSEPSRPSGSSAETGGNGGSPTPPAAPTPAGEAPAGSRVPVKVVGLVLVLLAVLGAGAAVVLLPGGDAPGSLVVEGDLPPGADVRLVGGEGERPLDPGAVTELPAGDYEVRASAAGFQPFVAGVTVSSDELSRLPIELVPTGPDDPPEAMAGLRVDRSGLPDGASLVLSGPDGDAEPLPPGDRIELAAGPYTLRVSAEGYTPSEIALTLDPGEEESLAPSLEEIPAVTGTLIVSGARPPGTRVTVRTEGGTVPVPSSGRLDLPPGSYRVEASAPEHRAGSSDVTVRAGEPTRVEVSPSPLPPPEDDPPEDDPPPPSTGTLTVGIDLPPEGSLEVVGPGGSRPAQPGTALELAPGSYTVRASAPGHEPAEAPAEVRAGESTTISIPALAPAVDAAAIARSVAEELVERFDRQDTGVTELLPEADRSDFTLLWNNRNVSNWSATLQGLEGEPTLDGGVIAADFVMQVTFISQNTPSSGSFRFRARIAQQGGTWRAESLERVR